MNLKRYPLNKNDLLQAWDSADELILSHLKSINLDSKKILNLNDQFGALACNLEAHHPAVYSDSYISHMGIRSNSSERIFSVCNLNDLKGPYDLVLIKLPKNLSFFEDELAHLTNLLRPGAQLIAAGMIKHMNKSFFDLIEKYIGKTHTSLAQKKARLIFASFQNNLLPPPYPISIKTVKIDGFDKPFLHHSNLFSRDKLDIGTRFFLEHLPEGNFDSILDLGCGNGILGVQAKKLNPNASLTFSDESFMAIQSAKINYQNHFQDDAVFLWTNCFEGQPKGTQALILCNPPFHQHHTVGDFVAWQMFTDAYSALKRGGLFRIVGNSHLGYAAKLQKIFGNCEIIAKNQKFTVLQAQKND